jgi:rusticyanin
MTHEDSPGTPETETPANRERLLNRRVPAMQVLLVVGVLLVLIVAMGAYLLGRASAYAGYHQSGQAGQPGAGSAGKGLMPSPMPATPGGSGPPSTGSPSLGDLIGKATGKALAGNAPQTVDLAQAQVLGNEVPQGAVVDRSSNRITFTTTAVSFVVEAVPPGNLDMTFRIAGLVNPAVVVHQGAAVTVRFINADPDQAHGWKVVSTQPPFPFGIGGRPPIDGATASVIGNPTQAGDGARTITFRAQPNGTYQYICPMPGHAQMGMHGAFIVTGAL